MIRRPATRPRRSCTLQGRCNRRRCCCRRRTHHSRPGSSKNRRLPSRQRRSCTPLDRCNRCNRSCMNRRRWSHPCRSCTPQDPCNPARSLRRSQTRHRQKRGSRPMRPRWPKNSRFGTAHCRCRRSQRTLWCPGKCRTTLRSSRCPRHLWWHNLQRHRGSSNPHQPRSTCWRSNHLRKSRT